MDRIEAPDFRTLSREEISAVLRRNHVGRIAFAWRDRVDVQPIHYVFAGGWIYGRTAPGAKLTAVSHNRWVAFEVDEVEEMFVWRSVVVHGAFHVLSPDGPEHERAAWQRGIELVQRILPAAFQEDDPVPFRTVLFRIAVQEASGRLARPGTPLARPVVAS